MSATQDLEDYLEQLSDKVQRNVEIVTPESLGQNFMLHISMNTNIREFVPLIGRRQSPAEDRTVPRVCVAPSLLGCFIGYGDTESNFLSFKPGQKTPLGDTWKGGWKIYALPFEAALKPSGRLLFDTKHSDEHWLVAYNKDSAVYTPEAAGKAFYRVIQYKPNSDHAPLAEGTLYVEVSKAEGIHFSQNHFLKKGYWAVEGPTPKHASLTWTDRVYTVRAIDKQEYYSAKAAAADLLSLTEQAPAYLNW